MHNHKTIEEELACPICSLKHVRFNKNISKEFTGSSPTVFVGRYNYPNVNIGIISLPERNENADMFDNPKEWVENNLTNSEVLSLRSSLINNHFKLSYGRYLDIARDIAKSKKYVDVDVKLKKEPPKKVEVDNINMPIGPKGEIEDVRESSNPKIPLHIDKVDDQDDMKAEEGIKYLRKHGYDENYISRILSVGILGIKEQRKIVPTRWSITATDDMISKEIIEKIKDYDEWGHFAFFGEYMGNYYIILFFPGKWSYELFEMHEKHPEIYSNDYEHFNGRKNYAHNCSGGYYTVRLAVAEKLEKMKRQATVFALRIITSDYKVPLGVWVTREAARKTLSGRPIEFSDKKLMVDYLKALARKKFGINVDEIVRKSIFLNVKQTSLFDY